MGRIGQFIRELKRRKVFRSVAVYLAFAFVVVQVVDAAFPLLLIPDFVGTIVAVLLIIGLPVTLILSWAFDFTLGGIQRDPEDVRAAAAEAAAREARLALRSDWIAVMPFKNLGAAEEDEYFSEGIAEDILSAVARIQGLRVLSRASVAHLRGRSLSVAEVAGVLGVAHLIGGTVRRAGSRVRIFVEVVDARTEGQLWSETYDRGLEDVFQVQSEVAAAVADAVHLRLSPGDRAQISGRGTREGAAYDLYLRARHLWARRTPSSLGESVRYYQQALEVDPDFALAHAGLADSYAILGMYGAREPGEVMPRARKAAERALALQPGLGEALTSLALVEAVYEWRWDEAERRFREAMERAPSYPAAPQWLAVNVLAPQGRFSEAHDLLNRALQLEPTSLAVRASRGMLHLYDGRVDDARETLEALEGTAPDFGLAPFFLAQVHDLEGRPRLALEAARRAASLLEESSESLAVLARSAARAGESGEAGDLRRRLENRARQRYVSPALLAQVSIDLDPDRAIEALEAAAAVRATDLIWLGVRPVYQAVREDSRYEAILGRLGLGPSQGGAVGVDGGGRPAGS